MKFILVFIASLFSITLFSQTNIDSLEALLPQLKDNKKLKTLNKISYSYWGVAPGKGIEYGKKSL